MEMNEEINFNELNYEHPDYVYPEVEIVEFKTPTWKKVVSIALVVAMCLMSIGFCL